MNTRSIKIPRIIQYIYWPILAIATIVFLRVNGLTDILTIALCIIATITTAMHIYAVHKDEQHTLKTFALPMKKDEEKPEHKTLHWAGANSGHAPSNRKPQYDYLRVLAVAFVIITHSVQTDIEKGRVTGEREMYILTILYVLTLSCNLLYVMISGALLLEWKDENVGMFYLKRALKVVVPLFIYYMWYYWVNPAITGGDFKTSLLRLVQGNTPECPHYWLIWVIITLYLVFPLMRYILHKISYVVLTVITTLIIAYMAVRFGLVMGAHVDIAPSTLIYTTSWYQTLAGWQQQVIAVALRLEWLGVAVIGYWISRQETRVIRIPLIAVGVIAGGVIALVIKHRADYLQIVANCTFPMTLFSAGIMSAILHSTVLGKECWLIRLMSRYSYGMILIHWWVLHWVTFGRLSINVLQNAGLRTLVSLVATLLGSLITAYVMDNVACYILENRRDK